MERNLQWSFAYKQYTFVVGERHFYFSILNFWPRKIKSGSTDSRGGVVLLLALEFYPFSNLSCPAS